MPHSGLISEDDAEGLGAEALRRGRAGYQDGRMGKINERIAGLEERLRELKAQQQRSSARQRTLTSRRERREDTRRKILLGAWVLSQVDRGAMSRESLWAGLDQFLIRSDDRALFELPLREGVNDESSHRGAHESTHTPRPGEGDHPDSASGAKSNGVTLR